MFNLSEISGILFKNLDRTCWLPVIEDDYPDFKHLVCQKTPGLLEAFSRLDVLVMTPELDPASASGICLCFLFYADPVNVVDMRKLGKLIRQDNFSVLQKECAAILNGLSFSTESPSITIKARPKFERIKFAHERYEYPAFFVELGYWISN